MGNRTSPVAGSLLIALLTWACSPEPQPIDYGADACAYCRMTIVDQQHGAEVVTQKGRVYKFDAIECMVNYVDENADTDFAYLLVNTFDEPGDLVDAAKAHYLISEAIPSPMGAFLSAFTTQQKAVAMAEERGGETYDWPALQRHFEASGRMRSGGQPQ